MRIHQPNYETRRVKLIYAASALPLLAIIGIAVAAFIIERFS